MIVFATVRCGRIDGITDHGFEKQDDALARYMSGDAQGTGMVYCHDEPVRETESKLPAEFHAAYVLDVPDDVLEKHVVMLGENYRERSGWLLPIDTANRYRGIDAGAGKAAWPCAIDLHSAVDTPLADLEDVERDDAAGWMRIVGDAIHERRAARNRRSENSCKT